MDNLSRKAKFENVKFDEKALKFHADKYLSGSVYPLAKQAFQYVQLLKIRTPYEIFLDELEEDAGVSNIKP
jgi:hypothetical protein